MKNYTPLHWWAAEPWLLTYLNLSQLLLYVNIHWLQSSESVRVAVMISSYAEKTFIFSTHSSVTCSKDCPWETRVTCIESHTNTRMHITRSHTLQTASLSKINDAWHCGLEKWPDWTAARWRYFSQKFPEPNKWCPRGNRNADFCSSRATRQSKRAPNNPTESWQSLSPRHKLADWHLNGRKYLAPCCEFLTNTNNSRVVHYNDEWMKLLHYIWHFVNCELSQPIPAFVFRQRAASVRDVVEDF